MAAGFITVTCAAPRVLAQPHPSIKDPPAAQLRVITVGEKHAASFPLQSIEVKGRVVGTLAEVEVAHRFENPFDAILEATYTFPLPQNAAVDAMQMRIGERVIRAQLKTKQDARDTYNKAKTEGRKTALLEQERPNIFSQSVANIGPGETIEVRLRYHEVVSFEGGVFEMVVPTTVGPRFIPGTPEGRSGLGVSPNTNQVKDASRITPPLRMENAGHIPRLKIEMAIAPGLPIHRLVSPSHAVDVAADGNEVRVVLANDEERPNKDFILRYRLGTEKPTATVMAHKTGELGHLMVQIQPPLQTTGDQIRPRELVFVVDNSGSMSGRPMEAAKNLMRLALKEMRPNDAFKILRFSERASSLSPHALNATEENVRKGLAYVDAMRGMGGTMMIEGVKAALDPEPSQDRVRFVLFLTDGYIGNDTQIIGEVKKRVKNSRLFSLGVGSSVNRYLLERMAQVGRGAVQYVGYGDDAAKLVSQFYGRIESPVMTDIQVDWGGLGVQDQNPMLIADLFSGQPLTFFARYEDSGEAEIKIVGRVGTRKFTLPIQVKLPKQETKNDVIATLWARREIEELELENINPQKRDPDLIRQATQIALDYEILSAYTSFVAVEDRVSVDPTGKKVAALQPVEMPDGMSPTGIPQSSFTRTHIPPGDPVLSVRAPADAKRVWAYFPFGERMALRWDKNNERWFVRFLVPKGWDDGVYQVRIVVEEKNGQRRRFELPYTLDGKGPKLEVRLNQSRYAPGQELLVSVKSDEKLKRLTMQPSWQGDSGITLVADEFSAKMMIPPGTSSGSHVLKVVGVDQAGNTTLSEVLFEVGR
jgi:Ca-activated chloride channel family protein